MIFERHYEDEKDAENNNIKVDSGNIDAEPYKFLEEEELKKNNAALQIIDEDECVEIQESQAFDDIKINDIAIDDHKGGKGK